jgi:hypothetical protein
VGGGDVLSGLSAGGSTVLDLSKKSKPLNSEPSGDALRKDLAGAGDDDDGFAVSRRRPATAALRAGAPVALRNAFDALDFEPTEDTEEDQETFTRPKVLRGAGGRLVRRVAAELRNWYASRREQLPEEMPESADESATAGDFKLAIHEFCDPVGGGDISCPCPKVKFRSWARNAFWDQISLSRLRFQGAKATYAVCRASSRQRRRRAQERCSSPPLSSPQAGGDVHRPGEFGSDFDFRNPHPGLETQPTAPRTPSPNSPVPIVGYVEAKGRRALVLHPPPRAGGEILESGYDESHARRQATFSDNADGIYERGLRVHVAELAAAGVPLAEIDNVRRGYDLVLREWPAQYHGRHYGGALDYPEKLQAEHERMLDKGYVEGPLLYVPWIVQSLGGVWKADKGKWRTIVDATSSGVNPACVPLSCEYDTLAGAISKMAPNCLLSSFDLTDAFLNWAYSQDHSDLMGYRDTNGDYFRYRFMGFGCAQSPAVQQSWAVRLKNILNNIGLKYCSGAAADYSTFECAMAYMDDFACVHRGTSPEIAAEQYASVLRVLSDLGFEDKASKRSLPATSLDILGFTVDTVAQTVTVSAARCDRLVGEIDEFLAPSGTDANRRELASIVGKLQWVAQIVHGGQLHLRRAYRARDAFVDPGVADAPVRQRWGRGVRVERTDGLLADLAWWKQELPRLRGQSIYLCNLTVANGFWRGEISENDAVLDAAGGAPSEDVAVITTDASGYGGGAWWLLEREAWHFEQSLRAPLKSSNFRELLTAVLSLERWGPQLRGRRVLIRTDNTTTASVLNTGDTPSSLLEPLARRLFDTVKKFDLRVAGRHIPGLHNGLSDGLSRWRYDRTDRGDWQFAPTEFARVQRWLQARLGRGFDVDACSDPTGTNSHCSKYWSGVDSCLNHDMAGMTVWCHSDWDNLRDVVKHFRECASRRPHDTAGVFVVPERPSAPWWRSLRGFRVLRRFPIGSDLFSRPDGPDGALSGLRAPGPPTKWPVLLLYWEPGARDARAGGDRVRAHSTAGEKHRADLRGLQLSGDGPLDAQRLHALRRDLV